MALTGLKLKNSSRSCSSASVLFLGFMRIDLQNIMEMRLNEFVKLIMQNSEGNQNQNRQEGKEKNDVSEGNNDESYDKLMKEAKQVIDNIHLSHVSQKNAPQEMRAREADPIIIIKSSSRGERPGKIESEEQEQDDQPDLEQRNQAEISSKNQAENILNMAKKPSKVFVGCNCIKSKCTKNYCECFTQARKCTELCKCTGCQNQGEIEKKYRSNFDPEDFERTCNCKRSNCLKKYCECFNSGVKCTSNCKCEECKNGESDDNDEMNEEGKIEQRKPRTTQEIEQINAKIEQIARLIPQDHRENILLFLEYWLS